MAARFPCMQTSFVAGGLAAHSNSRINGATSMSSTMPASLATAALLPQKVFENCGSTAASGCCSVARTSWMASDLCAESFNSSTTKPARRTAPSIAGIDIADFTNTCKSFMPSPPGRAKVVRTGASQPSHRSLATNSWHLGRCTSKCSCGKPPLTRKSASSVEKRSASLATMTFRPSLASSKEVSSRSTKPKRRLITPASRRPARTSSDVCKAPAMSWHMACRPPLCQHQ
mmetsp:Transcript_22265/g.50873  ORF Transcript_22265/g.50873 Transcript_22265/m.50873 type:complete len:230 (-) Transcript_22265:631-1320(-)